MYVVQPLELVPVQDEGRGVELALWLGPGQLLQSLSREVQSVRVHRVPVLGDGDLLRLLGVVDGVRHHRHPEMGERG